MGSVDAQPWSVAGRVSFAGRGPFDGMRPRGKPRGLPRGSDMIVGSWRISQVVFFKLFARTAELRESIF
jgi:hypothetical protein